MQGKVQVCGGRSSGAARPSPASPMLNCGPPAQFWHLSPKPSRAIPLLLGFHSYSHQIGAINLSGPCGVGAAAGFQGVDTSL